MGPISSTIPFFRSSPCSTGKWIPHSAIDLPHVINLNGATRVEEGEGSVAMSDGLTALGHEVTVANLNSGLHVIRITGDGLPGAADKRREGAVLGQ